MKKINYIKALLLGVFALPLVLNGCKEEDGLANAVMTVEASVTFEAQNASAQTVQVVSDGEWLADISEDWLTMSPMSGKGNVDVTIEVDDNVLNGTVQQPRTATIIFRGNNVERQAKLTVTQNGDTYLGVSEYTLAEIAKLDDATRAKVKQTQVVAVASDGFIATDATSSLYILGNQDKVKIGDNITMNGAVSTTNTVKTFTSDEVTVVSNTDVTYPEAKDVTSSLGAYSPTAIEYVKISGTLINKGLRVDSKVNAATCYNPGIDIEAVNLHKVDAYGYALLYSNTLYFVPVSFKDNGKDEELVFYPVKYQIRKTPINFTTASFSAEGKFEPIEGLGYIQYVPYDLANTNDNNKYKLDVSDSSPRCTGPWPGDYWLFYCYGEVKAGSVMEITFEARTSATGHKYWILEYLDGETWKAACDTYTADDVANCVYSHAMNADGATNVQAYAKVTIKKNMDNCQFRFRCVANWQANGSGALGTRNGGSARLSVTDTADDTYQPRVSMLKEGDGVEIPDTDPIEANITVSDEVLAFEGTPDGPQTLTVKSDYDFTVETSADWLTLGVAEGTANVETAVTVTCEPSTLSTLRQADIIIRSEETKKTIRVIQSAAGQELDPFISLSTGNSVSPLGQGAEFDVKVQHNVEFKTEISDAWLSEIAVPSTSAVVEYTAKRFKAEANLTGAARTGTIRFYNEEHGIESVLTVNQDKFEPNIEVTYSGPYLIAGIGETRSLNIVTNVPFTVTAPDWITLPTSAVDAAGTYPVSIAFAANAGESRTGEVVFTNAEYSYTKTVSVTQSASGVVFYDDFGWLSSLIAEYNEANPTKPIGNAVTGYTEDEYASASAANAPNAYTAAPFSTAFPTLFANQGYEDMNASGKVVYPQDTYLKFGKTSVHTSLKLPAWTALTSSSDVVVEFDWCAHIQGSGKVDPVTLTLVITGNGTFENGTKYSDALSNTQQAKQMFWTHASVKINGADKDTRVNIVYTDALDQSAGTYNYKVSGAHRWHIDNIKVSK